MLQKIETIEKQVMDLKLSVLTNLTPTGKNVISLKGILKGIDITEKDIATAKKSLYDKVKLWNLLWIMLQTKPFKIYHPSKLSGENFSPRC